ncbi:hypothetical protein ASPZODRAFT_147038 [Penicilliopsis zonata CBS 506.65]|uniref:LysM domain-containing protein n=1 Tax=Penicilliopsis zonata CBS 506.65 TaxID=1073090 RepID=A0A1L9S6S4_9EURO|nr:hypothetical protein ASPZODRAFT_147038 [Penicilliopsis zonata CBS 506.65]OJJ42872.1 hypothetical protein ASPZODRAFT_147038 [Penicilliopsis zonata CBS 506.65]
MWEWWYYFLWVVLFIQGGQGQVAYDPVTNALVCSKAGGSFCIGKSLDATTMASCVSATVVEVRSCGIQLAQIIPSDLRFAAVCFESSPSSGDAVCAFNGTGYTLSNEPVPVPGSILCDSVGNGNGSEENPLATRRQDTPSNSSSDAATACINPDVTASTQTVNPLAPPYSAAYPMSSDLGSGLSTPSLVATQSVGIPSSSSGTPRVLTLTESRAHSTTTVTSTSTHPVSTSTIIVTAGMHTKSAASATPSSNIGVSLAGHRGPYDVSGVQVAWAMLATSWVILLS